MTDRLAATVRLQAWLSPAFPTGGFAYSHGLEWAVEAGDIRDAATLHAWIEDILRFGAGRTDAILVRLSFPAPEAAGEGPPLSGRSGGTLPEAEPPDVAAPDIATADIAVPDIAVPDVAVLARALAASRERLLETTGQGTAFVAASRPWHRGTPDPDEAGLPYPVAVGRLAASHGIDPDTAVAGVLQAFAAALISAAVRLVPLGQSAGLAVLAALEPAILAVTAETAGATRDDLGGACFRSDIAAMRHETQYTRLFRS